MNKCELCSKEFEGKGKYCSPAHKQQAYRNRTVTDEAVGVTVTASNCVTVVDQIKQRMTRGKYAKATDPDVQEIWDLHESQDRPTLYPHEYQQVGMALPGDPSYDGVCHREAGAWRC